jgi:hypothetical protein
LHPLESAALSRRTPGAVIQLGTLASVYTWVYPHEAVDRPPEAAATAVILTIPRRRPDTSRADIEMTRVIDEVAKPLGNAVHDHIIVGKDGSASLKALMLMGSQVSTCRQRQWPIVVVLDQSEAAAVEASSSAS